MSARRDERGFTVLELVVVLVILSLLAALAYAGIQSSRRTTNARVMATNAGLILGAIGTFERIHPRVGATDPLLAGSTFTSTQTESPTTLYDLGGGRILDPWPSDPYTGKPLVVQRRAACPATGTVGMVVACRVATATSSNYRVMAWARNADGNAYKVYDELQ